ncbi:unnamed protein product [Fusarium fujikuroi]|nr:hypothetical protein CEK25_003628 [Fusarium fujikuroi]SCO24072.1 uncharacterized protein FFE2_15866 [Fusarium fujikuroi]VZH99438.1 unnamed protein product [Fusarium fujikuroi]
MEIRVCLADITNHLILSPHSAFRPACQDDFYMEKEEVYFRALSAFGNEKMELDLLRDPHKRTLKVEEMVRADHYLDLFKTLKAWDLMLDKDLPDRLPIEEIKKARLPILVYLPAPARTFRIFGLG